MNYKYMCLNPIADVGLNNLTDNYARTEDFSAADAVFVRSAKMDELTPGDSLLAVARAGAGVNNIPHAEYAKKGIVVFNTPGANANGVKELVIAAMLLASRDIVGGIEWVKANVEDPAINKSAEKAKKDFHNGWPIGNNPKHGNPSLVCVILMPKANIKTADWLECLLSTNSQHRKKVIFSTGANLSCNWKPRVVVSTLALFV